MAASCPTGGKDMSDAGSCSMWQASTSRFHTLCTGDRRRTRCGSYPLERLGSSPYVRSAWIVPSFFRMTTCELPIDRACLAAEATAFCLVSNASRCRCSLRPTRPRACSARYQTFCVPSLSSMRHYRERAHPSPTQVSLPLQRAETRATTTPTRITDHHTSRHNKPVESWSFTRHVYPAHRAGNT